VAFVVFFDASGVCLVGLLMQKVRVIAYASRKTKVHDKNYHTHDLELAAVVCILKLPRNYLYGVNCEMFSNHHILNHLYFEPNLNMRLRRGLE